MTGPGTHGEALLADACTAPAGSPIDHAELRELRSHLPTVQGRAFLNGGTTGPMPDVSVEAQLAQLGRDARDRQPADLWDRVIATQHAVRERIGRLTGADSRQVSLMHATHEGINACLWGCQLAAGDNIVSTDEEHPGALTPMRVVGDRLGVELRFAHWPADSEALAASLAAQVGARTRAVVVSHVSWVSGKVANLAAIAAALHRFEPDDARRPLLIVDGAQGAGALPVQIADGWDAYTVSGQKWTCGPNGSGALVLADPTSWSPTFGAYLTTTDPTQALTAPYRGDGIRLECCQEAMLPLVGLAASLDFLLEAVGIERAAAHSAALNRHARSCLVDAARAGHLHGDAHLLALDRPTGDAVELARWLATRGIVVRDLGPTLLRLSLGFWNTVEEVEFATSAIVAHDRS